MKKLLFGLTFLACAATASAYPVCVSFAPAGYCDAMQFDSKKSASWDWDCSGTYAPQTTARYKKKLATTTCDGTIGCEPAATYDWDSLNWAFDVKAGTGTLIGLYDGFEYVLQQDIAVDIFEGSCTPSEGGRSTLAR